jgi:hypothetical protein
MRSGYQDYGECDECTRQLLAVSAVSAMSAAHESVAAMRAVGSPRFSSLRKLEDCYVFFFDTTMRPGHAISVQTVVVMMTQTGCTCYRCVQSESCCVLLCDPHLTGTHGYVLPMRHPATLFTGGTHGHALTAAIPFHGHAVLPRHDGHVLLLHPRLPPTGHANGHVPYRGHPRHVWS